MSTSYVVIVVIITNSNLEGLGKYQWWAEFKIITIETSVDMKIIVKACTSGKQFAIYRASKASPTHTCLTKIVVCILDICLDKICGPGATYGGIMHGKSFGAEMSMH